MATNMSALLPPIDMNAIINLGLLFESSSPGLRNRTMVEIASSIVNGSNTVAIDLPALITEVVHAGLITPQVAALVSGLNLQIIAGILKTILAGLDHSDTRPKVKIFTLVLTTVTLLVVSLRIYSRKFVTKQVRPDDWAIVVAMLLSTVIAFLVVYSTTKGSGRHVWDITYEGVLANLELSFASEILYPYCLIAVKASLLLFYYSLTPHKIFRWCCIATGTIFTLSAIAGMFAVIFQCQPVDFWNHLVDAKCIDRMALLWSGQIITLVTDVLTCFLPVPVVWRLQLKIREKLMVIGLFSTGFFVCIASAMRLTTLKAFASSTDVTWNAWPTTMWSLLELNLAIMCACAPALKVLVVLWAPQLLGYGRSRLGSSGKPTPQRSPEQSSGSEESGKDHAPRLATLATMDPEMGLTHLGRESWPEKEKKDFRLAGEEKDEFFT